MIVSVDGSLCFWVLLWFACVGGVSFAVGITLALFAGFGVFAMLWVLGCLVRVLFRLFSCYGV